LFIEYASNSLIYPINLEGLPTGPNFPLNKSFLSTFAMTSKLTTISANPITLLTS